MKKIILVVLLALSVQGADTVCEFYNEKYQASQKLLEFSFADNDASGVVRHAKNALEYVNQVGANCKGIEAEVNATRASLKVVIEKFKE